jgi:hypothetical protein
MDKTKQIHEMTNQELSEAIALEVMGWKTSPNVIPNEMIKRGGAGYRYWILPDDKYSAAPQFAYRIGKAWRVLESMNDEFWVDNGVRLELANKLQSHSLWLLKSEDAARYICIFVLQVVRDAS